MDSSILWFSVKDFSEIYTQWVSTWRINFDGGIRVPGASASLNPIVLRPQCIFGCAILCFLQPHYPVWRAMKRTAFFSQIKMARQRVMWVTCVSKSTRSDSILSERLVAFNCNLRLDLGADLGVVLMLRLLSERSCDEFKVLLLVFKPTKGYRAKSWHIWNRGLCYSMFLIVISRTILNYL